MSIGWEKEETSLPPRQKRRIPGVVPVQAGKKRKQTYSLRFEAEKDVA